MHILVRSSLQVAPTVMLKRKRRTRLSILSTYFSILLLFQASGGRIDAFNSAVSKRAYYNHPSTKSYTSVSCAENSNPRVRVVGDAGTNSSSHNKRIHIIRKTESWEDLDICCARYRVLDNTTLAATALRRAVQLIPDNNRNNSSETADLHPENTGLIAELLKSVGSRLFTDTGTVPAMALTDILVSLGYLNRGDEQGRFIQLGQKTWSCMEDDVGAMTKESPKRLVECLVARSRLHITGSSSLLEGICTRLAYGDAISKLKPLHMVLILKLVSNHRYQADSQALLTKVISRRLRKQAILNATSTSILAQGVQSASQMVDDASVGEDLELELRKLCYTTLWHLFTAENRSFSSRQIADMVKVLPTLNLLHNDTLIDHVSTLATSKVRTASPSQLADYSSCVDFFMGLPNSTVPCRLADQLALMSTTLSPEEVSVILRPIALHHVRKQNFVEPYFASTRHLFLDKAFLSRARIRELSNFLWFQKSVMWNDRQVLKAVGAEILTPQKLEDCNPKLACRILSAYTALVAYYDIKDDGTLFELFDQLGEFLLSSQMSTSDISSAMIAYAKASYTLDLGIFDHLVRLLVARAGESTNRQLAQSYWACGKMIMSEPLEVAEDVEPPPPPYLDCAKSLAIWLSNQSGSLSRQDVAQAVWASACLQICDDDIIQNFAERARVLVDDFTAQEISNIIWGLSKVGSEDFQEIHVLLHRVATDDSLVFSPQEAASVLYALGRLDIRDDVTFARLTDSIVNQIESASAQAISNALWAHQAVHLTPPRILLDSWATSKLGIVPVVKQAYISELYPSMDEYDF